MHFTHSPLATVPAPRSYGVGEDEWFATPAPDAPGEFDLSHVSLSIGPLIAV